MRGFWIAACSHCRCIHVVCSIRSQRYNDRSVFSSADDGEHTQEEPAGYLSLPRRGGVFHGVGCTVIFHVIRNTRLLSHRTYRTVYKRVRAAGSPAKGTGVEEEEGTESFAETRPATAHTGKAERGDIRKDEEGEE